MTGRPDRATGWQAPDERQQAAALAQSPRWLLFAGVGAVAFGVDMSVLGLLVHGLYVTPVLARLASIVCAASVARYANRCVTFADTPSTSRWRQWLHYLVINMVNVAINYGSYAGLVLHTGV